MKRIRVSEIFRPSSEKVIVSGRVSQIWGPRRFPEFSHFYCGKCAWTQSIQPQFPYDNIKFPVCSECGRKNMEMLAPSGNFLTWYKIHLQEKTTHFVLELVSDMSPPKKGQTISFITRIHPRMKGRKLTINTWTGESNVFSVEAN
tara:strand:+ start:70 stop:504 length:435 start_codon:yes stop_codon:yes gene_type:complete